MMAGAQDTALAPILCAANNDASQVPSSLKRSTETLPSELAHASIGPSSCGAQAMALTEGKEN